jgi:tRNA-dihydrouridine synthase B
LKTTTPPEIGGLRLENPFLLAPLAGVSDAPFRRLCREQGAAMVCTEMISGKGLWYKNQKTEQLLRIYDDETPAACQIFGKEPEIIAYAAAFLEKRKIAAVDINMGCPVPKIVRNGEGAALLRDPDRAGALVEAAAAHTRKPVTVKLRVGWDAQSVNVVEMARTLEAAGAAAITVHGRTREQQYSGSADWRWIRLVKEAVRVPVVGNGDVRSGADALRMLAETGCDYVMIARGALGNPWIFREANALYQGRETPAPPSGAVRIDMLGRHFDMLIAEKGTRVALCEIRKHAGWYLKGLRGASALRGEINAIADAARFRETLARYRETVGAAAQS